MKLLKNASPPAMFAAIAFATLAGTAAAGDLQVTPLAPTNHAAAGTQVAVRNTGRQDIANVRVQGDLAHDLTCQSRTAAGRPFAAGGTLAAGDSVQCSTTAAVQGLGANAFVSATGTNAAGHATFGSGTMTRAQAAAPNEAIISVVGAAILQDLNLNGIYDAGETIDYNYTVFNVGNQAVSNLVVSDSYTATEGPVTCAATTLAAGATTSCTRSHMITTAEATAAQGGGLTDDVLASATAPDSSAVQASDTVNRTNLTGTAFIRGYKVPSLMDDVDHNGVAGVGDKVLYTFIVTNGDQTTLQDINITETDPTRIDTPITCNAQTILGNTFAGLGSGQLVQGDSVICTAEYTIKTADKQFGQVLNSASYSSTTQFASPNTTVSSALVMPPPPLPTYVAVPVNARWMLLALAALLGFLGLGRLAWRRQ